MDNYIRDLLHASSASHVQTRVVSDNARATVLGYITEALEISQRSNESDDDDYSPIINHDHHKRSSDRRERSRWASAAATSDAATLFTIRRSGAKMLSVPSRSFSHTQSNRPGRYRQHFGSRTTYCIHQTSVSSPTDAIRFLDEHKRWQWQHQLDMH